MLKAQIDDKDIKNICKKYDISNREFEGIRDEAGTFYSDVRVQHLSSIMRCLEIKGRYITKNVNFSIEWGEMNCDSNDAHSMFSKKADKFMILLPKNVEDEDARYIVAHELGHLFYVLDEWEKLSRKKMISTHDEVEMLKLKLASKEEKDINHRKANVFGILMLSERKHFYTNKVPKMEAMINRTTEEIITHFN